MYEKATRPSEPRINSVQRARSLRSHGAPHRDWCVVRRDSGELRLLLSSAGVLATEAVDAASRVDQALLARVKRMTLIADVDRQLIASRPRLERVTARTGNGNDFVVGVNAFLHDARLSVRGEADASAEAPPQQGQPAS